MVDMVLLSKSTPQCFLLSIFPPEYQYSVTEVKSVGFYWGVWIKVRIQFPFYKSYDSIADQIKIYNES